MLLMLPSDKGHAAKRLVELLQVPRERFNQIRRHPFSWRTPSREDRQHIRLLWRREEHVQPSSRLATRKILGEMNEKK